MPNASLRDVLSVLNDKQYFGYATIVTETRPKLRRFGKTTYKPCPFPVENGILHHTKRRVMLGVDYASIVERQRKREKTGHDKPFKSWPIWEGKGVRDPEFPRYIVKHIHTGHQCLIYYPDNDDGAIKLLVERWIEISSGKRLNPKKINITEYLKEEGFSKRQETQVQKPWRFVGIENVRKIVVLNKTYNIIGAQ